MTDLRDFQTDQAALVAELAAAGASISNPKLFCCPFHDDAHPSAGVYRAEDGIWRVKCQSGGCGFCGDIFDVRAKRLGVALDEVLKAVGQPKAKPKSAPAEKPRIWTIEEYERRLNGTHEATYPYTDPDTGKLDMVIFRHCKPGERKRFTQATPVDGGIILKAPPAPRPIYNRTRVRSSDVVIVCEGEKCVHALQSLGYVATTTPGGAGKAAHADLSPLANKTTYLWPDNDPPGKDGVSAGEAHMRDVECILRTLDPAPRLFWIDPTALGLPPKGDAADLLEMHGGDVRVAKVAVADILRDARPMTVSSGVLELIEQTISGKRSALAWPWPTLTRLSRALLPGTVTILAGDPGSSKSLLLLEAAWFWHSRGIKVALFELEEEREYHLHRALVQMDDNALLADDDWVKANPEQAREAYLRHADVLDAFGACIYTPRRGCVTLDELSEWVRQRVAAGAEIIGIDPITAAEASDKPWVADNRFLMAAKDAIGQSGARLVLVTHPKKGRKNAVGMEELAGGAAYSRLPQTALWLERLAPAKSMSVRTNLGDSTYSVDRVLRIIKARNGVGAGVRIGCSFNKNTLRLREYGPIVEAGG